MAHKPEHKLVWTDVESSNVQSVAYDKDTHTLAVRFHNGGLYSYQAVDEEIYVDLVHAESVGKYLNHMIKGAYSYIRWHDEQELLKDINTRKSGGR